ncbi:MAG: septal ring lytic transglycosylase RlpA family protein [Rhizobiales bacterium]|nr:septal ring lytic transglycosylase RlpA family protein [Hyphomicrobiales bacterium]
MKKHLILPALAGFTWLSGLAPTLADIGHASYYGRELAGRKTASGEVFRPEGMTAAHRSLPLGTRVKVTNLSNGKAVVLRINDRGPFVRGRMIDVSQGAARVLGFAAAGTARVKIEPLGRSEAVAPVGAPLALPALAEPQPGLPEAELLRNPVGNGN